MPKDEQEEEEGGSEEERQRIEHELVAQWNETRSKYNKRVSAKKKSVRDEFSVGDVVQIVKQGSEAGTEAVVTAVPYLAGEKELIVVRTSGPKAGRSAMYGKEEVMRTGKMMRPEQIEEIRKFVETRSSMSVGHRR